MAKKPGQLGKKKSTRSSRAKAAQKSPAKTKSVRNKSDLHTKSVPDEPTFAKLPGVLQLFRQSAATLSQAPRLFIFITALYALVYTVLVKGLSTNVDVAALRDQFANKLSGSLVTSVGLLGGGSSSSSPGFQIMVVLIFSLALIWALRQVVAGARVRVRDSLYLGMYPLVPFILVSLLALVELIPMFVGISVYELVIVAGIATTIAEKIIWGIGLFALVLLSLYLLASTIFALYIVTLPDMTPVKALRSASRLVRARRGTVMRKVLALPLVLGVVCVLAVLPFVLVVPVVAPWILVVLGAMALTFTHSYMYTLYRELLNE